MADILKKLYPTQSHGETVEKINEIISTFTMIMIVIVSATLFMLSTKKNKPSTPKILTIIQCTKCGYSKEREWKRGDFVGLVEGKCPKCGALMMIMNIYKESSEEQTE